jgi:hypothetical protein
MNNKNFNELRNREKAIILKQNYRYWKTRALENSAYFIIFQGFEEIGKLKNISGNALKLYIYLGLHSNNYEGVVWHSNKKISDYFGKSERTIRGWMKELEDLQLIRRMRLKYDGNMHTYLQPYISKENKDKKNEGILYFNEKLELCFQNDFKSYVLFKDEYTIDMFKDEKWVINIKLVQEKDFFNEIYYLIKDSNNENLLEIHPNRDKEKIFKIRMNEL